MVGKRQLTPKYKALKKVLHPISMGFSKSLYQITGHTGENGQYPVCWGTGTMDKTVGGNIRKDIRNVWTNPLKIELGRVSHFESIAIDWVTGGYLSLSNDQLI